MSKKRIVLMSGQERPWTNYELAKDCGLVPYLLMKNHGCDSALVCGGGEEYPYLKLMPGFRVDTLPNNSIESKLKYIEENGKLIDCMLFYGITDHNIYMADAIQKVNPKCIRACALDMNPDFTDRVPFYLSPFYEYLSSMHLMWQSDLEMTDFLNEKWYWEVVCERNGYYSLEKNTSEVIYNPFENRSNVFLYVGRVNDGQKNIGMLLRAFAAVADKVPDWKLRIVGPIEDDFETYIDMFFEQNNNLKDKVEFTGNIMDRTKLHKEYENAKIFVTTTRYEGGTPNAMAEAICSGCVIATTKIGAYKDVIGDNETGRWVDIEDEDAFSKILVELAGSSDLESMSRASWERGRHLYNMEGIVADIYGKLCAKGL